MHQKDYEKRLIGEGWVFSFSSGDHIGLHKTGRKQLSITQDKDVFLLSWLQMQLKPELWYRLGWMVVGDLWNYWCNTDFPGSCRSYRLYTYGFAPFTLRTGRHPIFVLHSTLMPTMGCPLVQPVLFLGSIALWKLSVQNPTNLLYFILFLQLWRNNSKYRKAVPSDIYSFTGTLLSGPWLEVKPYMQGLPEELLECTLLD